MKVDLGLEEAYGMATIRLHTLREGGFEILDFDSLLILLNQMRDECEVQSPESIRTAGLK